VIEVGDVVYLKSGGPRMTVDRSKGQSMLVCAWFDGTEAKGATFAATSLEKVEPATDAEPVGVF
jgi:uncharacterized protein YodC (DUF2158 family)